jgi:hypothetical protein
MQASAEIRYFWKSTPPPGLEQWFCLDKHHSFPPGGEESRLDVYIRDSSQTELGVKTRGNKPGVEIKGLVGLGEENLPPPFVGQVEIWAKWTSLSLELDEGSGIEIGKVRRLRKFDTSGIVSREVPLDSSEEPLEGDEKLLSGGCIVELTKLRLPNAGVWWTLGLEAFGTIWTVRKNLKLGAEALAARWPPAIVPEVIASYPAWLSKYAP